jgi:hypothetical protein
METTNFEDVLREAAAEAGVDPENPSAAEFLNWRRFATKRLDVAWRYHFWPDLGRCEQRYYRQPYNAAGMYSGAVIGQDNSANEVWWPLTGLYYVALTTVKVNTPPTDANGKVDAAHWAVTAQFSQTPSPSQYPYEVPASVVSDYDPTVTYTQGAQVNYQGWVYQLFAVSATGVAPTDPTAWGYVPAFDAYVGYEQAGQTAFSVVEEVFTANPRTTTRGTVANWCLSERGIQVLSAVAWVWVQYRIRSTKLTGTTWSSTTTYNAGNQVYYSSAIGGTTNGTPGNFYTVNAGGTLAGQNPDNTPNSFTVVAIPRIFHRYLVLGMAADWAKYIVGTNPEAEQQSEMLQELAVAELDDVKSLFVAQMGQRVKTQVRTR